MTMTEITTATSTRWHKPGALAVVACVALAFGWPTRNGDFLSGDDQRLVVEHYLVNHPSFVNAGRLITTLHDDLYQPLPMLSLQFDYVRAKPTPDRRFPVSTSPFHATNIFLHVVNSLLAAALAARIAGCPRIGFVAGVLFACHPYAVEPVAWISGRMMLLAAMFSMLTMLACLGSTTRQRVHPVGAVLAWLAAVASKVIPTVPLAAIWCALVRRNRQTERRPAGAIITMYSMLILISIAASGMVWHATHQAGFIEGAESQRSTSLPVHALLAAKHYVQNYLWPAELAAWSPPPEHITLASQQSLAALAILAGLGAATFFFRRWNRTVFAGLVLFAILIAPFLMAGAARRFLAADRYMYLPILGLHLAVASIAISLYDRLSRRLPRAHARVLVAVPVILLTLTWLTTSWKLAPCWANSIARDRRVVDVFPDSETAHAELAKAHNFLQDPVGALEVIHRARLKWPESPRLAAAASESHRLCKDDQAALDEIAIALEGMPRHTHTRYRFAQLLEAAGQTEAARQQLEQILDRSPNYLPAMMALARLHRAAGQLDEAVAIYERAITLNPYQRDSRFELAELLIRRGEWSAAEVHLRQIVSIDPQDAPARLYLAVALARQGRNEESLKIYDELLTVETDHPLLGINRAEVLTAMGHLDDAEEQYRAILAHRPDLREAVIGLHAVLQEQCRYSELPPLWKSYLAAIGDETHDRAWLLWSLALAGEKEAPVNACAASEAESVSCHKELLAWACAWPLIETDAEGFLARLGKYSNPENCMEERREQSRMLILALRRLPEEMRDRPVTSYALARAALLGRDGHVVRAAIDALVKQIDDPAWQRAAEELLHALEE